MDHYTFLMYVYIGILLLPNWKHSNCITIFYTDWREIFWVFFHQLQLDSTTSPRRQVAPSGIHLNGTWIFSQTVDFFALKNFFYLELSE